MAPSPRMPKGPIFFVNNAAKATMQMNKQSGLMISSGHGCITFTKLMMNAVIFASPVSYLLRLPVMNMPNCTLHTCWASPARRRICRR